MSNNEDDPLYVKTIWRIEFALTKDKDAPWTTIGTYSNHETVTAIARALLVVTPTLSIAIVPEHIELYASELSTDGDLYD